MSDNLQEQQDEVLALESILADTGRLEILDGPDTSPEHHYLIQIEIPVKLEGDGITVELHLPGEEDVTEQRERAAGLPQKERPKIDRSVSGKHWHCSVHIQHLPPLMLHVSLPSTYPSKDPPNAQLSAVWLTSTQITSLQEQLEHLWKDSAGIPVIYTWVDWLENSVLSFLGVSDTLVLQWSYRDSQMIHNMPNLEGDEELNSNEIVNTDSTGQASCDKEEVESFKEDSKTTSDEETLDEEGAVAGPPDRSCLLRQVSIDLQIDLIYLVRYSLEKELQEFTDTVHECCICFCTKTGKHFVRLNQCRHHFCKDCTTTYCTAHVKEGTVDSLKCPDPDCDTDLPPGLIRGVLDDETYQRYEKLTLQKALDKMGDVTWCPRCNQPAIKEGNTSDMASCGHCNFVFCLKCKSTWHGGSECSAYFMDIQKLIDAMKQKGADKEKILADIQKKVEVAKGFATVRANSRPCPHCGAPIQKISGCSHMNCSYCNQHFIWTKTKWSGSNFSDSQYVSGSEGLDKILLEGLMVKGYQLSQMFGDMQKSVMGIDGILPTAALKSNIPQGVKRDILKKPHQPRFYGQNFNKTSCPECNQVNLRGNTTDVITCVNCSMEYCYNCLELLSSSLKKAHLTGGLCVKEKCTHWNHGTNCPCTAEH